MRAPSLRYDETSKNTCSRNTRTPSPRSQLNIKIFKLKREKNKGIFRSVGSLMRMVILKFIKNILHCC